MWSPWSPIAKIRSLPSESPPWLRSAYWLRDWAHRDSRSRGIVDVASIWRFIMSKTTQAPCDTVQNFKSILDTRFRSFSIKQMTIGSVRHKRWLSGRRFFCVQMDFYIRTCRNWYWFTSILWEFFSFFQLILLFRRFIWKIALISFDAPVFAGLTSACEVFGLRADRQKDQGGPLTWPKKVNSAVVLF